LYKPDYIYTFSDIRDKLDFVHINNLRDGQEYTLRVAIDDVQLASFCNDRLYGNVADLGDIAAAVYTADRLSVRSKQVPRHIHINLPVRFPAMLNSKQVKEALEELLYWFTHDHWTFSFTERRSQSRQPLEWQLSLPHTDEHFVHKRVSLWSGGVDSLAGLCNFLHAEPDLKHILFGTGANTYIHKLQRDLKTAVAKQFPESKIELIQVPIYLRETTSHRGRNRDMRARGFIFMILGAVCAYLQGQNTLHIYENGLGAINLAYRLSEVGLDHARSVHPISLKRMGELVSLILGETFRFDNPFLFWTKAEMCKVFLHSNAAALINRSTTCDRRHRGKIKQCGWCSSCILRRQALAAVGIRDNTRYVVTHVRQAQEQETSHLQAMLHQVDVLEMQLNQSDPWYHLSQRFVDLNDVVNQTAESHGLGKDEMIVRLLRLYNQYVYEWRQVRDQIHLGGSPKQNVQLAA